MQTEPHLRKSELNLSFFKETKQNRRLYESYHINRQRFPYLVIWPLASSPFSWRKITFQLLGHLPSLHKHIESPYLFVPKASLIPCQPHHFYVRVCTHTHMYKHKGGSVTSFGKDWTGKEEKYGSQNVSTYYFITRHGSQSISTFFIISESD